MIVACWMLLRTVVFIFCHELCCYCHELSFNILLFISIRINSLSMICWTWNMKNAIQDGCYSQSIKKTQIPLSYQFNLYWPKLCCVISWDSQIVHNLCYYLWGQLCLTLGKTGFAWFTWQDFKIVCWFSSPEAPHNWRWFCTLLT